MLKKRLFQIPAALVTLLIGSMFAQSAFSAPRAKGVIDGRLAKAYPDKPNNVTSYEAGAYPKMEPLAYSGDRAAAKARLLKVMTEMPRAHVVTDDGDYLHVTFTSAIFRFVDDVEFLIDDGVIHFRSASRAGYSDLGANQKRMEEIRERFEG
jgi:uncharacterized protein (DUF1499 family)